MGQQENEMLLNMYGAIFIPRDYFGTEARYEMYLPVRYKAVSDVLEMKSILIWHKFGLGNNNIRTRGGADLLCLKIQLSWVK